jgi:hypothetical protein
MANNDYNIIKPVEGLQNIGGLTPTKHREEKKKRQNLNEQNEEQRKLAEDELNKSTKENISGEIAEEDRNERSVDYSA